ncbi:MAG: DUF4270 family protein [Bacteroidia bacterium]
MKKNTLKPTKTSIANSFHKLLFLSLILLAAACNQNDELVIDLDLNEFPEDTIILKDVQLKTIKEDSLRTDNLNFHVIGSINDSVFGPSKSTLFTQLGLGGTIGIPNNAELDSVILRLDFVSYYGDLSAEQSFDVYMLSDSIDNEEQYYNTSAIALGEKIGSIENFKMTEADGGLKIDISKLWGKNVLKPGSNFSKDDAFQQSLYGLAIVPTAIVGENEGVFYYFNLASANTYVNAYYHYYTRVGSLLDREYGQAEMQMRSNTKKFTRYTHNYSNTAVEESINTDSVSQYRTYIQALGGCYTQIQIPEIKQLANTSQFAFHKVELVIPCETALHSENIDPITFMDIKTFNSSNDLVDVADRAKVYWIRAYQPTQQAYVFNITSHAQNVLVKYQTNPDYTDPGLAIKAVKNEPIPFSAGRFVAKGSSALRSDGAYVRIYYSEIDQP